MKTLPRDFFDRSPETVARELLGMRLHGPDGRAVRIVETEAYAPDDPSAHSFRGETARNRSMFGPPGHLYVYFSYGVHWCANVVCGPIGYGAGVLLRAGEPLEGLDLMEAARGAVSFRQLCNGPGKLAQAMGIDKTFDGTDLTGNGPFTLMESAEGVVQVLACPRIGISKAVDAPLRFLIQGSPHLSRAPGKQSRVG